MVYSYLGSILFLVLYVWAASHYMKLDSKEMGVVTRLVWQHFYHDAVLDPC